MRTGLGMRAAAQIGGYPSVPRCAEVSACDAALKRLCVCSLLLLALSGCEGCRGGKARKAREQRERLEAPRCAKAEDCGERSPCKFVDCVNEECVPLPTEQGTSCDNASVCDGVARCDGKGRCLPGAAPAIDDGNACTTDACDPVKGVSHEPIVIDDSDVCTDDACDPRTGQITHTSVNVDDGNDCTLDACDPKTGVKHAQASPYYTCDGSCREGFHPAARSVSAECGRAPALRTFCAPSCGSSFHACSAGCPPGYHSASRSVSDRCGGDVKEQIFCQKTAGDSFHTCDERCPAGYTLRAQTQGGQCGARPLMSFCAKG